ncbi:MAG: tetratricopeptide repeat protein, partial [Dehalococcoidia bacterium]|nr:tetratricopeptide repeat protein [Dehalococcoidia bacterium]
WYRKALEIKERLGLEREAAGDYHQLGMIAQLRQQFDRAEEWYRKALEIFERLGHPPLLVDTLAQLGVLRRVQGRHGEAVSWLGQALAIAAEYNMRVGAQILAVLARMMKAMGEEEFTVAWRQAFPGREPPLEVIREFLNKLEGGTT